MEDNFNQNDFEAFLQDQVRNHRMYPSDSVWREIDRKLHGERRWPALTIAASMLLTATVLICVYFKPKPNIFSIQPSNGSTSTQQPSQKNNILNNLTASTPFAAEKRTYKGPVQNALTEAFLKTSTGTSADIQAPDANSTSPELAAVSKVPIPDVRVTNPGVTKTLATANQTHPEQLRGKGNTISDGINETPKNTENGSLASNDSNKDILINKSKIVADGSATKDYSDKNMVDDFLKEHKNEIPLHTVAKNRSLKNKFSFQVYAAPSVSYRKLLEDNSLTKENNGGPVGLNYVADVNKVVRHKPGTGIELGVSFMYNLSNAIRVKSGFQFNMRQYSIEAYRSSSELASIALLQNNRIDTINTLSFYRNNNGYYSAELVNRYYQLSIPLGIEWEIIGNKKVQLNVAGTIQPTYLLNRNAYLLSTNFKNYTESPGMVRQWNLNSNIEAFISFKAGDLKWQLGPQLRYQPYSTFIPQYPIKEHLLDYGIKLGVSRVIN